MGVWFFLQERPSFWGSFDDAKRALHSKRCLHSKALRVVHTMNNENGTHMDVWLFLQKETYVIGLF